MERLRSQEKRQVKLNKQTLQQIIQEELENYEPTISEGLKFHKENNIGINENIFRPGSSKFFNLFCEVRKLAALGKYDLTEEEHHLINETEVGEFALYEGELVPLDFPMFLEEGLEDLDEAKKKKKKKKDPPIGKPTKNTGGGKKYKVFVRNKKTGRVKKITYGDAKGGLKGNWNSAEARSSFASRHNCKEKTDRTKAGYWACRAHKDFGTNVPGRFW